MDSREATPAPVPAKQSRPQGETPVTASLPAKEAPSTPPTKKVARQSSGKGDTITPMMAQYLDIKAEHRDVLLFYRMGDFYELFFDDAVQASRALDITLTKRGKHLGEDIPMCGVPVHSHEQYLSRLIREGFKVAVCEQVEDPAEAKKRGAKAVVRREVSRVVTPGTLTEDALLDARRNNYLAAVALVQGEFGLAWIDVSTGDFHTQRLDLGGVGAALARLDPGEVLISEGVLARAETGEVFADWQDILSPLANARFDGVNALKRLQALYGVEALDAFGAFSRAEITAAGVVVDYIELTQKGRLPRISRPMRVSPGAVMDIDGATRRNLELTRTLSGERKGSLLAVIDRTVSSAGARLLAQRLAAPLNDIAGIRRRLDMVDFLYAHEDVCANLRALLGRAGDIERALSRLTLGRGGPRDLAAVRDGLALSGDIRSLLGPLTLPSGLVDAVDGLGAHGELVGHLEQALGVDLPVWARDGGFVRAGYRAELDEQRRLRDESRRLIAGLQGGYIADTGISSLKIKHNNVLGYFIEVPAKQAEKIALAEDSPYIHRQTMANAVRYTTVELSELESKIARAADQALALEVEIFDALCAAVGARAQAIARTAAALAALDVAAALAVLARARAYVRPEVDDSRDFEIEGGRHPVVESALAESEGQAFVANDCRLDGKNGRLWLLTGPNMAGKSTFLRQNALIAILAQMGSFVPARRARIGLVDRLFSRVGAADDLARGRSTFMVEMVETAAILNQAGPNALVILDEIGRGTSTYDGLSIAWAVVEHLHDVNRSRAIFATHYHELTALGETLGGMSCHTMKIKEWQGEVVFLHEVGPGGAARSYGVHVGRLAGLPDAVVTRAEQILESLEKNGKSSVAARLGDDLPLFSQVLATHGTPAREARSGALEQALDGVDPDALSPREALDILYNLKALQES